VKSVSEHPSSPKASLAQRKAVPAPGRCAAVGNPSTIDSMLVKAIARAFRWQKMLETGK
jgi:hypothetical protein